MSSAEHCVVSACVPRSVRRYVPSAPRTFAVPEEHQHKVLTFGIVLALIMRAIFIALGATLLALFSFMFLLFGLLLIYTAVQLFRHPIATRM